MIVIQFDKSNCSFQTSAPFLSQSAFFQHHVTESIRQLVHRDGTQRPRASVTVKLFSSCCEILDDPSALEVVQLTPFLTFLEWRQLIEEVPKTNTTLLEGVVWKHIQSLKDDRARQLEDKIVWNAARILKGKGLYEAAIALCQTVFE